MLDRFLGHDAWTTRILLERCADLSDAQLDESFDAGVGSVRATLVHTIGNVEVWTALMAGAPVDQLRAPRDPSPPLSALVARHEEASRAFGALARRIRDEDRLDHLWLDILDQPPREKTFGGAIGHVLTHNHFHRTELLHMLQRLGLRDLPEGDLLSWEAAHRRGEV